MAKIGVAIVGCGKAGTAQAHWFCKNESSAVVGVFNPSPDKAQRVAELSNCAAYDDWQTLVIREDVDLVALCGPESVRAEQAVFAANAGKAVLCEKPLANSLVECDAIVQAGLDNEVPMFAFFNMRYHPVVEAIDSVMSRLGEVYSLRLSYTQFRTNVTWRHKRDQHGGVLKSQGVHPIDLALRWAGTATEVIGQTLVVQNGREVEDFASIGIRFESGAVGDIVASYTDRREEKMVGEVHGLGGSVVFELSPYDVALNSATLICGGERHSLSLREPEVIDPVYPGLLDCSKRAVDAVVSDLVNGRPPSISAKQGADALSVVFAGYESQRLKSAVSLPLRHYSPEFSPERFPQFSGRGEGVLQ